MRPAIRAYARQILEDSTTSVWLRDALRSALARDPIEAAHDADLLRTILFRLAAEPSDADGVAAPGSDR